MYVGANARRTKGISEGDIAGRGETTSRSRGVMFQELSATERSVLQRWARQRTSPHRVVVRSRIVLLASEGLTFRAIAAAVHVTPATVRLWVTRFADGRLPALTREAPGAGDDPVDRTRLRRRCSRRLGRMWEIGSPCERLRPLHAPVQHCLARVAPVRPRSADFDGGGRCGPCAANF